MQLVLFLTITFISHIYCPMSGFMQSRISTWSANATEITDCNQMPNVRDNYHAIQTSEQLKDFIKYLDKLDCEMIGPYRASAIMQQAQYSFWPTEKLRCFNKGKNELEKFIATYPDNLEARYVRLLVQSELPGFLGYRGEIETDANIIKLQIGDSDLPIKYQELILKNVEIILKKEQK